MSIALPTCPDGLSEPEVLCGLGGFPARCVIEQAGRRQFKMRLNLAAGRDATEDSDEEEEEEVAEIVEVDREIDVDEFCSQNYYQVLQLKNGFGASEDEIKKGYHKLLLVHHPDKTGRGETDPVFMIIQDSFNTLSNENRRRAYDSTCDFDDKIPAELQKFATEQKFFDTFADVFVRNARFSETKPVPMLGTNDTPWDEVAAFYDFWFKFDSWRDFSSQCEHDVESADDRHERRYFEKENATHLKKMKKQEYNRLEKLVERAQKYDPRVKREREREKNAKGEKKRLREEAANAEANAVKAAKEAKEAEEAAAAAAAKGNAKEEKAKRDALKKAMRRARKGLEKLVFAANKALAENDLESPVDLDEFVWFIEHESTSMDQLNALSGTFGEGEEAMANAEAGGDAAQDCLSHVAQAAKDAKGNVNASAEEKLALLEQRKKDAADAKAAAKAALAQQKAWTPEETDFFLKCLKKFPGGTRSRWTVVAEYHSTQLNLEPPRSMKECLQKSTELQLALNAGVRPNVGANFQKTGDGRTKETDLEGKAAADAKLKADAGAQKPKADEWTGKQQKQFEAALAANPASMAAKERWSMIASVVEGKNMKQCVARFKEIRAALDAKKKGGK